MKKKSFMLVFFIITLATLVACTNSEKKEVSQKNSLEEIQDRGVLIVGTSADYPPNEFHKMINGVDTIVGFDIELAKYIASELGVDLEIKDMEFSNLLASLSTGLIDMVIAGMGNDEGRDANFSIPYDPASQHKIIINKKNEKEFLEIKDFSGKTLAVQTGSIQKNIADSLDNIIVSELPSLNSLILELKTDKIDGVIMPEEAAISYSKSNKDLFIVENINLIHQEGGACIALKTGNDKLTDVTNRIIQKALDKNLIEEWKKEAIILAN